MSSKKPNKAIWIQESCSFFNDVMKDTIGSILKNATQTEQLQMQALEKIWLPKYNTGTHQPKSNPVPLTKPKRVPRKRKIRDEVYSVDPNTLDDDVDIVYRINIPQLRPHWSLRSIDLQIKAYMCKKKLIESLINWDLLDRLMELPLDQATTLLQSHVDNTLQCRDI